MIKRAAVILAGGHGTRLWPVSTQEFPKFLLELGGNGNRSLFRQTFERLKMVVPADHIFVVTSKAQKHHLTNDLPEVADERLIIEPATRDTAPAVALSTAHLVSQLGDDSAILFLPSDHVINEDKMWIECINEVFDAITHQDASCYFGLRPTRASNAYGYIVPGRKIDDGLFEVKSFVEKPDSFEAVRLMQEGARWNSGMFVAPSGFLAEEMKRWVPEIYQAGEAVLSGDSGPYKALNPVSIDFALHPKVTKRIMIAANYSRIDVGNWESIRSVLPLDDQGNAIMAKATILDCKENTFYAPGKRILALGVSNLVFVESGDDILLMDRDRVGELKELIASLRIEEDKKKQ